MLTADGPKVLEYNTRFGDPETQVVLPRLRTDVVSLLWAAAHGELAQISLDVRPEHALCVVIAARGYPDRYPKGDVIQIPDPLPPEVTVYHAGTARSAAGELVTHLAGRGPLGLRDLRAHHVRVKVLSARYRGEAAAPGVGLNIRVISCSVPSAFSFWSRP
jgi:phosphoribosylamine--glycine ligase